MGRLILEYDALNERDNPAISGDIYAMVFHPHDGSALDFDAVPYGLAAFDGDQEEFSIPLVHRTPRTRYYSELISSADLILPDNADGEQYFVEYWRQKVNGTYNRAQDELLKTEKLPWHDSMEPHARLSIAQEQSIADRVTTSEWAENLPSPNFTSHFVASYDPETLRLGVVAWLEKDGVLQEDAQSAVFEIFNSDDISVASGTSTTIGDNGQFQMEDTVAVENVVPDETYYATIEIRDSDGVWHKSGAGVVTWD